jgi:hypothetical protein
VLKRNLHDIKLRITDSLELFMELCKKCFLDLEQFCARSASRSVTGLKFRFTDLRSISGMSRIALLARVLFYGYKNNIQLSRRYFLLLLNSVILSIKVMSFNE